MGVVEECRARWRANNYERELQTNAAYRARNRASFNAMVRDWKRRNPDRVMASVRKRQAAKMQRVPAWADDSQIRVFYKIAVALTRAHGVPFEVDHIIPLQGKTVSGLHVQGNLQVIRARDNYIKGNRYE